MSEQEKKLKRKRGSIKSRLTLFQNYVELVNNKIKSVNTIREVEQDMIIELESRLQKNSDLLTEFEQVQDSIDGLFDDLSEQINARKEFEDAYFKAIATCKKISAEYNKSLNSATNESPVTQLPGSATNIKLPEIQLPKFNGNYDNWLEFRDTFESLIHVNQQIGDIQKFHYLRSSLEDSPLNIINALEFSATNYIVAWELMCNRYNNRRLLIHNHVKAMFNLPTLHGESANDLRKMLDNMTKHLRSLNNLDQKTEHWDTLIIYIMSNKLDRSTARKWEEFKARQELPTLEEFKSFLKSKADLLETLDGKKDVKQNPNFKFNKGHKVGGSHALVSTSVSCYYCRAAHYLHNCGKFLKLSIHNRVEEAKKLKLCLNCLRANHSYTECRSSLCQKCNGRHNTLLHFEKSAHGGSKTEIASNLSNEAVTSTETSSAVTLSAYSYNKGILLSTAVIQVSDSVGNLHTCRALLDSASESNFITAEVCKKLKLEQTKVNFSVIGINQGVSILSSKCTVELMSRHNSYQTSLSCYVIPQICDNIPGSGCDISTFQIPQHIKLADPEFYKPHSIDILLGAGIFWHLLCIGQISLGKNQPMLQKTRLGWIISGPVNCQSASTQTRCNVSSSLDIQNQLSKFWELEDTPSLPNQTFSKEEQICESIFVDTTRREQDGRFVVTIPLKESVSKLGESKQIALNKFYSLENRLRKNPILKNMYGSFMQEYEALGHMSKVSEDRYEQVSYYFPHHGVINEHSSTTKLRVVFNGSAPSDSGWSFNNLQLIGPTIQEDLLSITLRFRTHNIVVGADISKMYRQILVNPDQRCLQKIFWRSDPTSEVNVYTLNTVTYGTASAPFLAVRCLRQLAIDYADSHPIAAQVIARDFYVDDMLSGAETVEEAVNICKDVISILTTAGFTLHKWSSNSPEVLKQVSTSNSSTNVIQFGEREGTKTLGLFWSSTLDVLMYSIGVSDGKTVITKRSILSDIAHIFDPLGLLSPCVVTAKIMLQKLWLHKLSWDEALPSELHTQWQYFRNQLSHLNHLQIPRKVVGPRPIRTEIHGFSDASLDAYAACVYLRTIDSGDNIYVSLLCARSKVAPLKSLTIPRLELCGALILIQLIQKVKLSINLKVDAVFLWSDSTIVLNWINTEPSQLQTFVSNRVAQIQVNTENGTWRHVRGDQNPADLASRGVPPNKLIDSAIWWHGPSWLAEHETVWPTSSPILEHNLPETRKQITSLSNVQRDLFPFNRFSRFIRLLRVTAYGLRFMYNCRNPKDRLADSLTVDELDRAEICLVKVSQRESFPGEVHELTNKGTISSKSSILNLNPFLDSDGVLRVGGRLENSLYNYEKKHPKILSSRHHFTNLIFDFEHIRLFHAGPQLLLSSIKDRYWPIAGRNLAKRTYHSCIKCYRAKPKITTPIMGALPELRTRPQSIFYATGVDYAGPMLIRDKKGRGSKLSKCYVAVFICFSTKAVHLELVSDLSTEAFLMTFRRFVSRRGKPKYVFSDNGKNFVGAAAELRDLGDFLSKNATSISDIFSTEGIIWKFIPAHSPHFGGLWEAGVKSFKFHMKRVIGDAKLTFEQFYTVITQIEAILNSRPLTPISSDPNDLDVLTPGHFLIGRRLTSLPEGDVRSILEGRLNEYQRIQQFKQHLWTRWSKEYVNELQQRVKWKTNGGALLKPGALVIIKEDNTPTLQWRLGRIIAVHEGPDGVVRVATVRTQSGLLKRSFAKLCVLPIDKDST